MNVSTFTLGLFIAHSSIAEGAGHWRKSLGPVLRQPAIYAITLAWILKDWKFPFNRRVSLETFGIPGRRFGWLCLDYLGVQLSKTKVRGLRGPLTQSLVIRLVGGPCVGILLTWLIWV
jgi:predicted permease